MIYRELKIPILFLLLNSFFVSVNASEIGMPDCGRAAVGGYGPFDYTKADNFSLNIVEKVHFLPEIEALIERPGKNTVISDLDYTLRAFPNHHRALMSVAKYRIRNPWQYRGSFKSADCYFKMALDMKPDDGVVYLLYGIYKHKLKMYNDAEKYYLEALKYIPAHVEVQYNLGLLYFDKKDYVKAKEYAKKAYLQNFPLKGLEDKLKREKAW